MGEFGSNGQAMYFMSAELQESMAENFETASGVFNDTPIQNTSLIQTQLSSTTCESVQAAGFKKKNQKKTYHFEINPTVRKRQQTRLLRKLQATLSEYMTRLGQQAVLLMCTPSKNNLFSFKVVGSKLLDEVLQSHKDEITNGLNEQLSLEVAKKKKKRKMVEEGCHELPAINVDGIPTPIDKMTQAQLRMFIPQMMRYSTLRSKPGWSKKQFKPPWWPEDVPWANVRCDIRSEDEKAKRSWTEVLRKIITSCYTFHGRLDLLPSYNKSLTDDNDVSEVDCSKNLVQNDTFEADNDFLRSSGLVSKKDVEKNNFIYLLDSQQQLVLLPQTQQQLNTKKSELQQIVVQLKEQPTYTTQEPIKQEPRQASFNNYELFLVQLGSSSAFDSSIIQVENQQSKVEKEVGNIIQSNNMISHENVEEIRLVKSVLKPVDSHIQKQPISVPNNVLKRKWMHIEKSQPLQKNDLQVPINKNHNVGNHLQQSSVQSFDSTNIRFIESNKTNLEQNSTAKNKKHWKSIKKLSNQSNDCFNNPPVFVPHTSFPCTPIIKSPTTTISHANSQQLSHKLVNVSQKLSSKSFSTFVSSSLNKPIVISKFLKTDTPLNKIHFIRKTKS